MAGTGSTASAAKPAPLRASGTASGAGTAAAANTAAAIATAGPGSSSPTTPETPSRTVRRPRRDAAQSYRLVVDAARELLGESGVDASMEQIAARAGVGVGTLYRRFPCKESLVEELVRLVTDELVAVGERILAGDDGTGLEAFLRAIGESFTEHRHWAGLLLPSKPRTDSGSDMVRGQISQLFANAHRAGTLGPDARLGDVMALIWGMRGLISTAGDVAEDAWRRYLDVHLAGLRGAGRLSPTPAIDSGQLRRLTGGRSADAP